MLRTWLHRLSVVLLSAPRVIYDQSGARPYLSRWYLKGRPKMPDGSSPFDRYGNPREGAAWPEGGGGWGLYLHRFHRGDEDRALHSHPWTWAVSLILAGGYIEERRTGDRVTRRSFSPGDFNFLSGDDYHRVILLEEDAWTLFLVGPKTGSWGFWERDSGMITPWREYFVHKQTG